MAHRFSNSQKVRQEILALAAKPTYKAWGEIPLRLRLLILEHIMLTAREVLRGQV